MDALQILREDHEKIRALFNRIEEAEDDAESRALFEDLHESLITHSFIEETVFYPAFTPYESLSDLLEDSIEDHQEMAEILEEMDDLHPEGTLADRDGDDGEFIDLLEDLRDLVEEHIETEEVELFPRVADLMKSDEIERLGQMLMDARDGARKHPSRAA